MALAANKSDMYEYEEVTEEEGIALAKKINAIFQSTTAKEKKLINIKIALIGDAGVGKTSIAMRYANNEFKDDYASTGGAAYSTKTIQTETQTIHLDIWDTAGQEKFRSLAKVFYKNAAICVLVYEITRRASFEELQKFWIEEIKANASKNISK